MRSAPGRHRHVVVNARTNKPLVVVVLLWWWVVAVMTTRPAWAVPAAVVGSRTSSPLAEALKGNSDLIRNWDPVQKYLTKYGYLSPSSSSGADNLRTEDQLRESIMTMQEFGGLTPSGHLDAPTLELLTKKRCGMPDMIGNSDRVRRYAIQGQKWHKKNLTWSIKDWPQGLGPDSVRSEMIKAFKVWSDVSELNFQETRRLDADIVVSFERGKHGDGYAFDGKGIVLAHAFFPGDGIGGDAHFDTEEPWVRGQPPVGIDGVSLFPVAVHEFGHSLGLSHSSMAGSLMSPFYQTTDENFELPYDDRMGIQILYGARNPTRWVPLTPYIPAPRTTTTTRRPPYTRPARPGAHTTPRTRVPQPTHKPYPQPTNKPHSQPKKPHTCNTTFDAVSAIRTELYIFKGKYFWRLNSHGLMTDTDYPVKIDRFFYDSELEVVDAIYERTSDGKIVFFSGKQYWLFEANTKDPGYPRPLTDLGLPPDLKKIDAAMVWGYNGKTYLFSGTQYWRYDENERRVELDYPRDMAMWRGIPYNIDAAFQNNEGVTYFFKGRKFWQFNDQQMKAKSIKFHINQHWLGCSSHFEQAPELEDNEEGTSDGLTSKSEPLSSAANQFLLASFVAMFLILRASQLTYL